MVPGRGDHVRVGEDVCPLVLALLGVQLVRLEPRHVVVVAEVPGGGRHAEVVAGGEVHAVHGEARLPAPLVVHVVAHRQLVALVPANSNLMLNRSTQ